MNFSTIDYIVFGGYVLLIVGIGLWVSREKEGHEKDTKDYFLASKALPWWAIGASLIASNISAEQFIGMSGSGFRLGLAIATYEWMAAVTLLIVAWFFLPIYLQKGIFTMPQFLEVRYDSRVRTLLAVFWLLGGHHGGQPVDRRRGSGALRNHLQHIRRPEGGGLD
jgi:SSS family solute:Na+ symporter